MWLAALSLIFVPNFRRSAGSPNCVAIPICWACSVGFASCVRPWQPDTRGNVCSASPVVKRSGSSRPSPPARSHLSRRSSLRSRNTSPEPLSPEDDHRLQAGTAPHRRPVFQCPLADSRSPESASENVSTCHSTVCVRWDRTSGHCMFLSESFTPNVWYPLDSEGVRLLERIQALRAMASPGSSWRSPNDFLLLRVGGRLCACFKRCAWRWRMPPNEPAAPIVTYLASPLAAHLGHGTARLWNRLPALMKLMGHKNIRMTLRYLKVTQPDLQREFHTGPPKFSPILTAFPRSPSPRLLQICLASARHSRRHAIYWKCTDGNSPMTRPAAVCSGSINGFSPSPQQLQNIAAARKMRKDWPVK